MPQTLYKGYELQSTGGNPDTWGTVLNDSVIDPVDSNMGSVLTVSTTGGSTVLSTSQARSVMLRVTGALVSNAVIITLAQGFYLIENLTTGSFTLELGHGDGTATIFVPQNTRGAAFADTANGIRLFSLANITNPVEIPTGTRMLFTSGAVPTGWTLITGTDDYALQVTSGTGGSTGGSVAYSTLFGRTATDSFTLTDCPAHAHVINSIGSSGTSGAAPATAHWSHRTAVDGQATAFTDNVTGGNGGHTHGLDMRVLSVTTIIGARAV